MNERQRLLSQIPSVDELLKLKTVEGWLKAYPRGVVLTAIRHTLDIKRALILAGETPEMTTGAILDKIGESIKRLSTYRLRPLINATGIIIHTNLGRSLLSKRAIENICSISNRYSNLEYDLSNGKRGKRYSHIKEILREITGAEDAIVVNNNAAAVLLSLNTIAKGKEVIVSRGELVEIGGSFRIPDVMASSGAVMREVGTTNKTHLRDYEDAVNENTALLLKVHTSNYRIIGFTADVPVADIAAIGAERGIPTMFDLGSGCLIDLSRYGIDGEPNARDIIKAGVDIVSFSGDKLLGGPQGGVIAGKKHIIERLEKNPLTRALRIDKLTLAALEATLMEYRDEQKAVENIPPQCSYSR